VGTSNTYWATGDKDQRGEEGQGEASWKKRKESSQGGNEPHMRPARKTVARREEAKREQVDGLLRRLTRTRAPYACGDMQGWHRSGKHPPQGGWSAAATQGAGARKHE